MSQQVADYAIVGDGQTVALIARDGSVDFLCRPRFDDDSPFNAILGDNKNGHWRIAPVTTGGATRGATAGATVERRYGGDTLILQTPWAPPGGRIRITDFMPPRANHSDAPSTLIRIADGLDGIVPMHMSLRLRLDYGSMSPWTRPHGNGVLCGIGPNQVVPHSPLPTRLHGVVRRTAGVRAGLHRRPLRAGADAGRSRRAARHRPPRARLDGAPRQAHALGRGGEALAADAQGADPPARAASLPAPAGWRSAWCCKAVATRRAP